MRPGDYEVAIPSYRRAATLTRLTLPLLADRGVDPRRIRVFVADAAERADYLRVLPADLYREVRVGAPGMGGARNAIAAAYPAGTPLVQVDDDIRDVIAKTGPNTSSPVGNLHALFVEMFTALREFRLTLWGVYAVANPYFMQHTLSTDLRYVVGALWGVINDPAADHCRVSLDDKEDVERTVLHYLHAGGVLRRNDVAVVTRYYTEPGGMQVERTPERVSASAAALVARYPHLCRINTTKRSGRTEVRLRDATRRAAPAIPLAMIH